MSEVGSIAEDATGSQQSTPHCPVCELEVVNVKKLKIHLLLKHPKVNLCLFCVEKKGWSDTFATQSSYNAHYSDQHGGVLEKKEKCRAEDREWRRRELDRAKKLAKQLGEPSPKRVSRRFLCTHCQPRREFEDGNSYERHLIADHGHDYCRVCKYIGPSVLVRCHILAEHSGKAGAKDEDKAKDRKSRLSCYVCCGSGPIFRDASQWADHLANKHGLARKTESDEMAEFVCYECEGESRLRAFTSAESLRDHLIYRHEPADSRAGLRTMAKRSVIDKHEPLATKNALLRPIAGIRNPRGSDCYALSVLHLLAQTSLATELRLADGHESCPAAACLMARFMAAYASAAAGSGPCVDPGPIVDNLDTFGVDMLNDDPVDCGDFLRLGLQQVGSNSNEHCGYDVGSVFGVAVQWKFECTSCRRFSVTNLRDVVVKIDAVVEKSLGEILRQFVAEQTCCCGHQCPASANLKAIGDYLFIELDRSISSGDGSKDLNLYSLKLEPSYKVFGITFSVIGTVNYMLDNDEGGHYTTYVYLSSSTSTRIHETERRAINRKPDFDVDAVIVALKAEKEVTDSPV